MTLKLVQLQKTPIGQTPSLTYLSLSLIPDVLTPYPSSLTPYPLSLTPYPLSIIPVSGK